MRKYDCLCYVTINYRHLYLLKMTYFICDNADSIPTQCFVEFEYLLQIIKQIMFSFGYKPNLIFYKLLKLFYAQVYRW